MLISNHRLLASYTSWRTSCFDYVHLYQNNASLLIESLEVVQQTAAVILAALQPSRTETMTDAELVQVA